MNPLLRLLQLPALALCPHGEDLGQDRERRLLLRVGADVEAARAGDPPERLLGDPGLEQPLAAPLLVSAGAERADVERLRLERAFSAGSSNLSSWVRTTIAVWWSGATSASASSGHLTISSSADGMRSRVANFARASATIAVQPSSFAALQSASAVSTAP